MEDPAEVRRRLAPEQLFAAHVAPLNRIVGELRLLPGDGTAVPWFDPAGAGIHGRLLVLAQDPSRVAHEGTGFISPDNPDPTADNVSWLRDEAGLKPSDLTHWNTVPWFIDGRPKTAEASRARPWLERVLAALEILEVVVCFGDVAANARNAAQPLNQCKPGWRPDAMRGPEPIALSCAHTTNRNILAANKTRSIKDGLNPRRIRRTLTAAAGRLDLPHR